MNWDELNDYYKNSMNQTQNQINNLQNEKQAALTDYETGYNTQLNEYKDLQNQQQNYIDTWAANQKEQQQKQTDYNIALINQNKEEAAKEKEKEVKDAYVDYMKQTNQFGGALENLASRGLATQGYAESSRVAMYNTYQNRVATANEALTKANVQYDNQMQQALLNNDAALAETAFEQMAKSYQLALEGFKYRSDLYNERLNYIQNINNIYYDRENDLRALQASYAGELGDIRKYQEELALEQEKQRIAQEQWEREFAEEQRQFNTQMSYKSSSSSGGSGGSGGYSSSYAYSDAGTGNGNYPLVTDYYQGNYNKDSLTNGKVDPNKVFSNGYQPNNINGQKLIQTGYTATVKTKNLSGKTKTVKQNVWQTPDGNNWLWDGTQNKYVKYTLTNVPKIITGEEINRLQQILNS